MWSVLFFLFGLLAGIALFVAGILVEFYAEKSEAEPVKSDFVISINTFLIRNLPGFDVTVARPDYLPKVRILRNWLFVAAGVAIEIMFTAISWPVALGVLVAAALGTWIWLKGTPPNYGTFLHKLDRTLNWILSILGVLIMFLIVVKPMPWGEYLQLVQSWSSHGLAIWLAPDLFFQMLYVGLFFSALTTMFPVDGSHGKGRGRILWTLTLLVSGFWAFAAGFLSWYGLAFIACLVLTVINETYD